MTRSRAESKQLARIKSLPCGVCGQPGPSDAHHIREGQGMGQRADDYLAIPLCKECHQGKSGIHGDRSAWRLRKLDELQVLASTYRRLIG